MAEAPDGLMSTQRVCFVIENTWTMSSHWQHFKRCLGAILAALETSHGDTCEVALVTYAAAWPYSTCPLQGTQWSTNLGHIRHCIEGIRPSLGGSRAQPLLSEALSEVAYLFQCPSNVSSGDATSGSARQSCHCVAFAASEPSKTPVPWPHPEDCHSAPGLAGYTELCLALRKRGVDFSFVSPQHLACQDAISRIGRAFVSAQGFKASSEARKAVVDIGTSIRCFIAPTWPLGTNALQLLNSDPLFFKDVQPQASSAASAAAEFKQPAPPAQHAIDIKAEPLERAQHESAASADPNSQQQAQQQNIVWQGRMFLGEAVTRGAPQLLWTCSMLVLGPENADLARGWSSELNIVEVNRSASLVTDLRDPSRQRLRGVIQLSTVEELGKGMLEKLAQQQLMAQIDMSKYVGVPACMVVMTLPSKRAAQPGSPTKLPFIVVDRSAPQL
ncbi:g1949 [Coccomyxa viridis]|uniref:Mediator of RNA polymerase II transcription subunit 25 n=1 Tax=Coccomyxa viridis TaxID=1274662 RepID=A0ABP1FLD2_9CHLO